MRRQNVVVTIDGVFCPSGVRALPLAAGINEGGHYFRDFGPSGVRALLLTAGINVGGHYFLGIFPLLLLLLVRAACVRCHATKCPLLTAFFSLSLFFRGCYFSPRRSYRRVPKFSMGF